MTLSQEPKSHRSGPGFLHFTLLACTFAAMGIWMARDLHVSRRSILAERSGLAIQTAKFMTQWYGTTITSTDYVLRDITTKVTPAELDAAGSDPRVRRRLCSFVREKLKTLPGVWGLGFVDRRCVFTAVADERVLGIRSNSKLRPERTPVLEDTVYIEYVPASRSANRQPAILVSRPMLSPDGRFLGGAVAAIMLTRAQAWLASIHLGQHDTMAMMDEDGILLAANPPNPSGIGNLQRVIGALPRLGGQGGSLSFLDVSPMDGRERIWAISKVDGIPLDIVVGFDKAQTLREWRQRAWQFLVGFMALAVLSAILVFRHLHALAQRDALAQALSEVRILSGLLPICAWCKCVRDDTGYWQAIESYVSEHSSASFTHGICPKCSAGLKAESASGGTAAT